MCLFVDKTIHSTHTPIRVERDLKVYKVLSIMDDGFITPYQATIVNFVDGKCVLTAHCFDNELRYLANNSYQQCINNGIHSYRDNIHSVILKNKNESYRIFKAIIPKGTLVWFGLFGEICSEKLIIYNEII